MTSWFVRLADVADAADIARIRVAAWRSAYAGLIPEAHLDALDEQADTERFTLGLADTSTRRRTLVAASEQAGRPVAGFIIYGPDREQPDDERLGEVYAINLDPAIWRGGCGTALMHAAEQELVLGGATRVRLWTLAANTRARAFYESRGYTLDLGAVRPPRVGAAEVRLSVALHVDDADLRPQRSTARSADPREQPDIPYAGG